MQRLQFGILDGRLGDLIPIFDDRRTAVGRDEGQFQLVWKAGMIKSPTTAIFQVVDNDGAN
jgi:hypothetical protein